MLLVQHDNSPIHKSKKVAALLESREVAVLEWPPQSPDLNVIEKAWGNMHNALAHRQLRALTADALWAIVQEEWERLRSNSNYFRSLPNRIQAVLNAGGGGNRPATQHRVLPEARLTRERHRTSKASAIKVLLLVGSCSCGSLRLFPVLCTKFRLTRAKSVLAEKPQRRP